MYNIKLIVTFLKTFNLFSFFSVPFVTIFFDIFNIPVKIVGDVMKQCQKLLTTCVYLCYSKYLFLAHRSSKYLSFCMFTSKEKLTLEKKVNFKSYMQFLEYVIT